MLCCEILAPPTTATNEKSLFEQTLLQSLVFWLPIESCFVSWQENQRKDFSFVSLMCVHLRFVLSCHAYSTLMCEYCLLLVLSFYFILFSLIFFFTIRNSANDHMHKFLMLLFLSSRSSTSFNFHIFFKYFIVHT